MAAKNERSRERGGALLEGVAALGVLLAFTSAVLIAAYLLFARLFIQYESEQALLCLARARPAGLCKLQMRSRLRGALPWGNVSRMALHAAGEDAWQTEVEWQWNGCRLHVRKVLSVRRIVGSRS